MEDLAGEKEMTVVIKYPVATKKRNKVFFEKKDQEFTNLDRAKWGGWFDTDGSFSDLDQKIARLGLVDRHPVELFSKTFETSLTNYLNKTITPEGVKHEIIVYQAAVRGKKAEWLAKTVYPYLIKEEKKDYAAKLLGYRPESKDFEDWTPEEVRNYIATALEGDGYYGLFGKHRNYIQVFLYSRHVQYLSDVKTLVNDKLGGLFSGISERRSYKTKKGEERTMYRANGYGSSKLNFGIFQSFLEENVMTLDRKKQRVQEFVNYKTNV